MKPLPTKVATEVSIYEGEPNQENTQDKAINKLIDCVSELQGIVQVQGTALFDDEEERTYTIDQLRAKHIAWLGTLPVGSSIKVSHFIGWLADNP